MSRGHGFTVAPVVALLVLAAPGLAVAATGTDEQAAVMVRTLAPDYRPWASPLFGAPGEGVESLWFALQAALGLALLVYCLRVKRNRARAQRPGTRAD